MIKPYRGIMPRIDQTAFISETSVIIGDVDIGAQSSVWYGCIVRGDVHYIKIGKAVNIQDGSVIHATKGRFPTIIGDRVTIGHGAILHGCTVNSGALIGIGSVILDNAEIGEEAMVAAGAVVSPETKIPPRTLAVGIPARARRNLSEDEIAWIRGRVDLYLGLSSEYLQEELDKGKGYSIGGE